MISYMDQLVKTSLFRGFTAQDLQTLIEPDLCILSHYKKQTIIMQEGDLCRSIGFVLKGAVSVWQILLSGEVIQIHILREGDCLGPALLYTAQPIYPYTLDTASDTSILYLPFAQMRKLLQVNPTLTRNYIAYLSDRMLMFQQKIRILSQRDVRSRLILYLAHEAKKAKGLSFPLAHSKTEIANLIGVARPSVPRELKHMQEDGLLQMEQGRITIAKASAFNL